MSDVYCPAELHPQVLKALYDNSRPQGLGWMRAVAGDMSLEQATQIVEDAKKAQPGRAWMDYVGGRPIKVGFCGNEVLRVDLYDRDNGGPGTAQRLIEGIIAQAAGASA